MSKNSLWLRYCSCLWSYLDYGSVYDDIMTQIRWWWLFCYANDCVYEYEYEYGKTFSFYVPSIFFKFPDRPIYFRACPADWMARILLQFFPTTLRTDWESNSSQQRCTFLRAVNSGCITDWATGVTLLKHSYIANLKLTITITELCSTKFSSFVHCRKIAHALIFLS